MVNWTDWSRFPDPRKCQFLNAPIGPGVYELRDRITGKPILFGIGKNCALRMTSLLPHPLGAGNRNNTDKRNYVIKNIDRLEYRCCACSSRQVAANIEHNLKKEKSFMFPT